MEVKSSVRWLRDVECDSTVMLMLSLHISLMNSTSLQVGNARKDRSEVMTWLMVLVQTNGHSTSEMAQQRLLLL